MAKVCQITGRKRMTGNNGAHSKLRTKRDFSLNLKNKRFWSEEEQRFITLKVSCKGMRIIEKNGLEATLRDAQKKGLINLVLFLTLWQRKQKETGCRSSSSAPSRRLAVFLECLVTSPRRTRRILLTASSARSTTHTSRR